MEKSSAPLRFLYGTVAGRCVLRLLVRPSLSRIAGRFLDTKFSRILIPRFKKSYNITTGGTEVPSGGFSSFNSFFTRKRTDIVFDKVPSRLCSPCDGFLTVFEIDEGSVFYVKGTAYSLGELLRDESLAAGYVGGQALIYRLTPANYHRYHHIDNGKVTAEKRIDGVLHTVREIATEKFPVYIQNTREYAVCASENFGTYVQMEVGALLVGRIKNHPSGGSFSRGDEKGMFEFGGSTVIMLFEKDAAVLHEDILKSSAHGEEYPVRAGDVIGDAGR